MSNLYKRWISGNSIQKIFLDIVWEVLHFWYILVGNFEYMDLGKTWSRKKKNIVRTILFCFFSVYMIIVYNQGVYLGKKYFKYHSLIFAAVILIVAFLSREVKLEPKKWNLSLARWFLLFWLAVCVSDFIVAKRFSFIGYIMLLFTGIFFLVWQHMEYPEDILWNFLHAVEILAVAGAVYNMFFRLKYSGLLYNGYMKSASDFGVFSAFLFLVFLVEIYECIQIGEFGGKMGFCICGVSISTLQVLLSGKEIALFYLAVLDVAAIIWWLLNGHRKVSFAEKKRLIIYVILAFGIVCIYFLAVKKVPWYLQTMVQYKKEIYESRKDPAVIAILGSTGMKVYQNVQFHAPGETIQAWKLYLGQLNLFGHKLPNLVYMGKQIQAKNSFLQIMYRYGIVAIIPYGIMFCLAGKNAVKDLWDKRGNWKSIHLLAAGVFFFWWSVGLFWGIEYPYYQPIWFFAYLLLGRYMIAENEKQRN